MRKYRSAKELAQLTKPGRYAVGHGCYLQISQWGTRAWLLRYIRDGVARHVGLGSATYVTLAEARQKAFEAQRQLHNGIDPLEVKRATKRARQASAQAKTLKQCATEYISAHEDGWRGDRSRTQWVQSLEAHVFPKIGDMPIADVDVAAVLSVLDPIAKAIPETAKRIKNRLALILDWAASRDLRPHDNPAKRPNLLPKRKRRVQHFIALDYRQMPSFMGALRLRPDISARALEFQILTAARPGEALGARWVEFDERLGTWTTPGNRMKTGKEHRVPLSAKARELLRSLPRESEYVFPGPRTGGALYPMALRHLLRRMGYDATAHGFRSSFRDWAAEETPTPNHVVEMALAHAVANDVEGAYRRGDLFEKRRELMTAWENYCAGRE